MANNSMRTMLQEYCIYSLYFAPRGKARLLFLGDQIGQRHLTFHDKLIGVIGDAGSGKSSLIKGVFPGLELTNDDDRLDMQKIMQVRDLDSHFADATTFHIDMRFQLAFTQVHEIADFVNRAIDNGKRVVVEHFNLLFPAMERLADIMIGIGEEIILVRPTVFGPDPRHLYEVVHASLKYRKMAHTTEDLTIDLLKKEFGIDRKIFFSSDIKNGFMLRFTEKVDIDFDKLDARINERLEQKLPVRYHSENEILVGEEVLPCSGPRIHVRNTSEVEGFFLEKRLIRDDKTDTYCLVGLLQPTEKEISKLNNFAFTSADFSSAAFGITRDSFK